MIHLGSKAIVLRFYRDQAGLFLVWFGVAFGILTLTEHVTLAAFFISHPGLLLAPALFWGLYTGYVIRYLDRLLRLPEYQVIRQAIACYPIASQQVMLCLLLLVLLLPIHGYGLFMVTVMIHDKVGPWGWGLLPILGFWQACALWAWQASLGRPEGWLFQPKTPNKPRPAWLLPLLTLRYQQPWLAIGTKTFTVLFLWLACWYTQDQGIDTRGYGLAFWVVALAHLPLLTAWQAFYRERLLWLRNLPISKYRHLGTWAANIGLLFLPELFIWLRFGLRDSLSISLLLVPLFGYLSILALHAHSQSWAPTLDKRMGRLFGLLILGVLVIMYQVPLWALCLVAAGVVVWRGRKIV